MLQRLALTGAALCLLLIAACGGEGSSPPPPLSPTPSPLGHWQAQTLAEEGRVILYGADAGDHAGAVLAGDFNGDGVMDLLLTAAAGDGPANGRPDSGEAYLFWGPFPPGSRRDAAAGEYDVVIYGAQPGDQLGRAAAMGDFNGDGIDDIALGAPLASPDASRPRAGVVYLLLGSAALGSQVRALDLSAAAADATIAGADPEGLAGLTLASADLDADGADDLLIGAPLADGPDGSRPEAGEAYVIYSGRLKGEIDLAAGDQDVTLYGADPGDRLGEALGAGDINGDGRADLIAAATFADGPFGDREAAGEVYVLFSPLRPRLDLAVQGLDLPMVLGADSGDQLGHSLASGDTDGDGFSDLWLGALSADGVANEADLTGEVHLVLGGLEAWGLLDTAAGDDAAAVYGPSTGARLGRSAAAADLDGDGLSDLIVAAPNAQQRRGALYLLFGRPGTRTYPQTTEAADLVLLGLDPGDIMGHEAFGRPPPRRCGYGRGWTPRAPSGCPYGFRAAERAAEGGGGLHHLSSCAGSLKRATRQA